MNATSRSTMRCGERTRSSSPLTGVTESIKRPTFAFEGSIVSFAPAKNQVSLMYDRAPKSRARIAAGRRRQARPHLVRPEGRLPTDCPQPFS
jgi:hypothetical protein